MKKKIIVFIFALFILFNSFMPNIVYANAYTPVVPATPQLVETAKYAAVALAPFAPEIALVACVCIGVGVVWQNREQIITVAGDMYTDLKRAGHTIVRGADNTLSMGADSIGFIQKAISDAVSSGSITAPIGFTGSVIVANPFLLEGVTIPIGTMIKSRSTGGSAWTYNLQKVLTIATIVGTTGTVRLMGCPTTADWLPVSATSTITLDLPAGYTGEGNVCVDFPTGIVESPTLPYSPDTSVSIPMDIPLSSDVPLTNDWVGDLVGTKDFTDTFPIDVPIDTPIDVPIDVPIDASITDALPNSITDKMDLPRFDNTLKKIGDMDTTRGIPPVIKFDLNGMFLSATSRLGSPKSPFHVEPYTLIDFGILQNYKFMNIPLIDYFRGLIGMGFIITTILYVWRKLIPQEVIL